MPEQSRKDLTMVKMRTSCSNLYMVPKGTESDSASLSLHALRGASMHARGSNAEHAAINLVGIHSCLGLREQFSLLEIVVFQSNSVVPVHFPTAVNEQFC